MSNCSNDPTMCVLAVYCRQVVELGKGGSDDLEKAVKDKGLMWQVGRLAD